MHAPPKNLFPSFHLEVAKGSSLYMHDNILYIYLYMYVKKNYVNIHVHVTANKCVELRDNGGGQGAK